MMSPRRDNSTKIAVVACFLFVRYAMVLCFSVSLKAMILHVAAEENPAKSCDGQDTKVCILEDSVPSLHYGADENDNKDDENALKAKDFETYFSSYNDLDHQKMMLTDTHRMDSYFTAILGNAKAVFEDKIVMDVGTGSGILAIWAAKAGAKKVYAIEYTDMAHKARKMVRANGVEDIVTVIQGTVEGVRLPFEEDGFGDHQNEEVVDVIVSEWMGYMLIRESMLDSVLVARDRYLKKDTGLMFPSHTSVMIAPILDETNRLGNIYDYEDEMDSWLDFVNNTKDHYGGVDYSALSEDFEKEQFDYYIRQSMWQKLKKSALMAKPQVLKTLDLMTCTHKDTRGIFDSSNVSYESAQQDNIDTNTFDFILAPRVTEISGFAGWFTAEFKSRTDVMTSANTPQLIQSVTLNTGPDQGYTHWGQQAFYFLDVMHIKSDLKQSSGSLPDGLICGKTTTVHLKGRLEMFRTKDNARLYECKIEHSLEEVDNDSQNVVRSTRPIENTFAIP